MFNYSITDTTGWDEVEATDLESEGTGYIWRIMNPEGQVAALWWQDLEMLTSPQGFDATTGEGIIATNITGFEEAVAYLKSHPKPVPSPPKIPWWVWGLGVGGAILLLLAITGLKEGK